MNRGHVCNGFLLSHQFEFDSTQLMLKGIVHKNIQAVMTFVSVYRGWLICQAPLKSLVCYLAC